MECVVRLELVGVVRRRPVAVQQVPPVVDQDLQVREDLEVGDAPRLDAAGVEPSRLMGLRRPPRPHQATSRCPFDWVRVLGCEEPPPGARGGHQPVWSVDLEVPALERGVGLAHLARHLLRVQGRHVVVLLESVGEDLPVAVVMGDEIVTLGHLFERVVVQRGDHRTKEFAQVLAWLRVEVDEDEPVPDVTVHRAQAVLRGVEVEELAGLLHERELAFEVVAPTVVLAGELRQAPLTSSLGKSFHTSLFPRWRQTL